MVKLFIQETKYFSSGDFFYPGEKMRIFRDFFPGEIILNIFLGF
jgi:hypothetical protein